MSVRAALESAILTCVPAMRLTARLDPHVTFTSLGMDSVAATEVSLRLSDHLGLDLPLTIAFEFPTLALLEARLTALIGRAAAATGSPSVCHDSPAA